MINNGLFTSESVTEGHPDKMCDQISDKILDSVLKIDPYGRVACESLAGNGFILVTGEISYNEASPIHYEDLVREAIRDIGYTDEKLGLDYKNCDVMIKMNQQSQDIAQGVDLDGAGDQGMMFGFATNETTQKMPMPISFAHQLTQQLAFVRKSNPHTFLGPDGKAQITFQYKNKKPQYITTVVVSTQHHENISQKELREYVLQEVVHKVIPSSLLHEDTKFYVNPTGKFVIGGPQADVGLTGRKIIVDTYGGFGRHGGGAFSGKDATKVDRSGAYIARYIAKNIVAAHLAEMCEVQLAYVIGVKEPVSIYVDTFGTGKTKDEDISAAIKAIFPLTPRDIREHLQLTRPIFQQTASYGHFGREIPDFLWEKEDKITILKEYFNL